LASSIRFLALQQRFPCFVITSFALLALWAKPWCVLCRYFLQPTFPVLVRTLQLIRTKGESVLLIESVFFMCSTELSSSVAQCCCIPGCSTGVGTKFPCLCCSRCQWWNTLKFCRTNYGLVSVTSPAYTHIPANYRCWLCAAAPWPRWLPTRYRPTTRW
jgi:hypothetical protein